MSVKIIFGTAGIPVLAADAIDEELRILQKHSITELDTASIYVRSARVLLDHQA